MVAGTNFALTGEFPTIALTSDTALLKVSLTDGSIVSSAVLDPGEFEFGLTPVLAASSVFVPVSISDSNPLIFESTNTVVKLPTDFSSASGIRLPANLSSETAFLSHHQESDTLLISPFNDGAATAITITTDLETSTSCVATEAFTPTVSGTISGESLDFTIETPTVNSTDLDTVFSPTTLMVSNFEFELTDICDTTPPDDDPPMPSSELSFTPTPDGFTLSFPTEMGMIYQVRFSTDLTEFSLLEIVSGDGSVAEISVSSPLIRSFYTVIPTSLEP